MHLQILGTAAAEGWPGLFCQCSACEAARRLGGKDLRTRSSVQIGDECKIDFPPDTLQHVHRYGLQLAKLRHLFFTHSHQDHMDVQDMLMMNAPFGHNDFPTDPLNVYMSADAARRFRELSQDRALPVDLHLLRPFEAVQAGTLTVTPVLAEHNPNEECLFFILEEGGKSVLYASDTGPFPEVTWEFLLGRQHRLNSSFSQSAMSDLAAVGAAQRFSFACRKRRHIVMMHVALVIFLGQTVERLSVANRAKRCNRHNLCLAACKYRTAVRSWEFACFAPDGANIFKLSAVRPYSLVDDLIPDDFLCHII
jgi:phosphoribosyl 1,2-cyclic phosphate phosphodiesterase